MVYTHLSTIFSQHRAFSPQHSSCACSRSKTARTPLRHLPTQMFTTVAAASEAPAISWMTIVPSCLLLRTAFFLI